MSRKPTPTTEVRDLRAFLEAVLDALTLPYNLDDYDARVLRRAALARVVGREALAEAPGGLGWNVDFLRKKLDAEQTEADERAKNSCGRCRTPFDPKDTTFDGRARHSETPWCRRCIDICHDGSAEHVCVICDPRRYGGDGR
ncbi:hypothetical protein ACFWWT_04300 [Streptomyces sp. NPDC058676]|uniref:hypothetical protein n=1 Tax=Streptomyces sp. NPDC058676 TaxID=3346593 RepID=UPI00365764A7